MKYDNDICDLDPNKICDNCCKCIDMMSEGEDADYSVVMASFDLLSEDFVLDESGEENEIDIFHDEIDPELFAQWEAKLQAVENEEMEKYNRPYQLKGTRRRREHHS